MKIILTSTSSRRNAITKSLGYEIELTGKLREETSIINPAVMVNVPVTSLASFNYMYIPAFKRYYFIDNIESITNNQTMVTASVDVLMSFRDDINNCIGTAERNQYDKSGYLNDDMMIKNIQSRISCSIFPNKMNGESYVLVVNGFSPSP